jgi:hypothetical protein
MQVLRTAIAILATATVLLVGAWAGGSCGPAQAQPGPSPRLGTAGDYAGRGESAPIPVGDRLAVQGQPMELSVFYTADSAAAVIAFYSDAIRRRGLLPIAATDERVGHVSVLDPLDGLQRSVTAVDERPGRTLVLLGVTDPRNAARLVGHAPQAPYPVPEDHRAFMGFSSEDGAARAHSGHFVTALAPKEVAGFYRDRLGAAGYAQLDGDAGTGLLMFQKKGTSVSVAVQALGERSGSAVFVNQVEGGP